MTAHTGPARPEAAPGPGSDVDARAVPGSMWRVHGADGTVAAGWYLLPLRLFLGVTFLYAGLQKLANPNFFRSSSPISIHSQILGASHTSPIGSLLGHMVGAAPVIGVVIALGEVAVGVGALLGLLTRVAAVGGLLLSFSLFLAISFHTSPYFTGADIVFLFAWTPYVLAGAAGPRPSTRGWRGDRRSRPRRAPALHGASCPGGASSVSCGREHRRAGRRRGRFRRGVLLGSRDVHDRAHTRRRYHRLDGPHRDDHVGCGRCHHDHDGGRAQGDIDRAASQVPVGGSAAFNDPSSGDPSLVIQKAAGEFVAFDAVCPHAGCTVAYQAGADIIACPCHGSEFNPPPGRSSRARRQPA